MEEIAYTTNALPKSDVKTTYNQSDGRLRIHTHIAVAKGPAAYYYVEYEVYSLFAYYFRSPCLTLQSLAEV